MEIGLLVLIFAFAVIAAELAFYLLIDVVGILLSAGRLNIREQICGAQSRYRSKCCERLKRPRAVDRYVDAHMSKVTCLRGKDGNIEVRR